MKKVCETILEQVSPCFEKSAPDWNLLQSAAQAVLWLQSNLSGHMNGTTTFVHGGMSTFPAFGGADEQAY